jgi:hypothetical protein
MREEEGMKEEGEGNDGKLKKKKEEEVIDK